MTSRQALKEIVRSSDPTRVPLVWDAVSAQLAATLGAKALFVTGFGAAAAQGLPDIGLVNQTEAVRYAARIAAAVEVPVIMDADDGFGSLVNLARTLSLVADSRLSGLVIEDQPFPKRSNLLGVREVMSRAQMVERVALAVDLCRDHDVVVVARTDAVTVHGVDDALGRAAAYADAGADAVFVTDLDRSDLAAYGRSSPGTPKMWLGPDLTDDDARRDGIGLLLSSAAMHAAWRSYATTVAAELGNAGDVDHRALLRTAQRLEYWDAIAARQA